MNGCTLTNVRAFWYWLLSCSFNCLRSRIYLFIFTKFGGNFVMNASKITQTYTHAAAQRCHWQKAANWTELNSAASKQTEARNSRLFDRFSGEWSACVWISERDNRQKTLKCWVNFLLEQTKQFARKHKCVFRRKEKKAETKVLTIWIGC